MTKYLPVKKLGEVKLAANLCKFFDDVDVNGDGSMEWDEFTAFIIDKGMGSKVVQNDSTTSVDLYGPSPVLDKLRHDGCIEQASYFPQLDQLVVFSQDVHTAKVVDARDCTEVAVLSGHKSEVLCAEYIACHNWLATSGNDRTIKFWDVCNNSFTPVKFEIAQDTAALAMRWDDKHKTLFTSDSFKGIHATQFEQNRDSFSNNKELFKSQRVAEFVGHTDVVLDLMLLDNIGQIASASMDSTVGIWDIGTQQKHVTLGGHKKGVFQLAYHPDYHAVISASYEHVAAVWNPYSGNLICQLKGHFNPLVGVQTVPNSPQILTADSGGVVKVWDIRTYTCVQTVHVEDHRGTRVSELACLVSVPAHKRIVAAGSSRLHLYDSMSSTTHHNPEVADVVPVLKCLYNTHSDTFVTASGTGIKVWNNKGLLDKMHRQLTTKEITAVCLDSAHKKVILGDAGGVVRVFNYLNGAFMKQATVPTGREITGLAYVGSTKHVLVTGWDGSVYVYDEEEEEDKLVLLKQLKHKPTGAARRAEVVASCYSENLSLFATGSSDGNIVLWDTKTHHLIAEYDGHVISDQVEAKTEVTCLHFLDPYPLLVSADTRGNLCVWAVRPIALNVGRCIVRIVNFAKHAFNAPLTGQAREKVAITALAFWEHGRVARLFGGDSRGVIRVWDIRKALDKWGFSPFVHTQPNNSSSSSSSSVNRSNTFLTSSSSSTTTSSSSSSSSTTTTTTTSSSSSSSSPTLASEAAAKALAVGTHNLVSAFRSSKRTFAINIAVLASEIATIYYRDIKCYYEAKKKFAADKHKGANAKEVTNGSKLVSELYLYLSEVHRMLSRCVHLLLALCQPPAPANQR